MPDTVSNGGVTVVNTGSSHTAFTGADPCLLPPGAFDNAAPAASLTAGTRAQKTLIGDNPIGMQGSEWDPSKSAGKLGVTSGTTQKDAVVTAGSKDLIIEGKPAARAGDATTQNHGNSSGKVMPGTLKPSAESQEERAKKLCYLKSWKGVTNGGIKLGWKGAIKSGEPNYLEVWNTAELTFTATREDITQAKAQNPKCTPGTHTEWSATGKVFPHFLTTGEKKEKSTDTFSAPASLVVADWIIGTSVADFANHLIGMDTSGGVSEAAYDPRVESGPGGAYTGQGIGLQDLKAAGTAGTKGVGFGTPGGKPPAGPKPYPPIECDIKLVLLWFWWFVKAPTVDVTATACGGARKATILVLPELKLKFKYKLGAAIAKGAEAFKKSAAATDAKTEASKAEAERVMAKQTAGRDKAQAKVDALRDSKKPGYGIERRAKLTRALAAFDRAEKKLEDLVAALETAKKVLKAAEIIATVANTAVTYVFLKDFTVELEISYERTKETQGFYYYTDATMGQKWKFTFKIDKLIGVDWTCYVSLLNLAGPYMQAVAQFLRKYKIVQVDLFFRIELSVSVSTSIEKSQVDEFSISGGGVTLDPRLSLGLILGVGSVDLLRATFVLSAQAKADFKPPKKEEHGYLLVGVPSVRTGSYYVVTLFPDRWWEIKMCQGQLTALHQQFNLDGKVRVPLISMPA
ncbi:MAG: DUF4150 domain-containing protein [Myxococcales bacterium]|nr:DUF4150 domain-containing protein [Myxococcales bacterium]